MADNLRLYSAKRSVPAEAQRSINAGRLKGKTDINPMWRIKALTEMFGPAGEGWWYTVDKIWSEEGNAGERCAFVQISLYYKKEDGQTSSPVIGIGGNMLVTKESKGLYTSDECYKMALTDAISVACKEIGIGADVYWQADSTKYYRAQAQTSTQAQPSADVKTRYTCSECNKSINDQIDKNGNIKRSAKQIAEGTAHEVGKPMCLECFVKWKKDRA